MKNIRYRALAGICMLSVLLPFFRAFPADADAETSTLSLYCLREDEIVDGMHWQIFRVGHREADDYVFEGDFSEYRPTLGDESLPLSEWDADMVAAAAETMRVYALVDRIANIGDGYTDEQGCLKFSGLEDGLYLVVGDRLTKGIKTYVPGAIFFEVDNEAENELDAFPKIIYLTMSDAEVDYSVAKIWKNRDDQPPDTEVYITCEIYCDGELQDTVRLDKTNNWTYTWSDKNGREWLVKEKEIPENYTVSYWHERYRYYIVNTLTEPSEEETTAAESTTTSTAVTSTTASVTSQTEPGLPQTGQLWWPVPILSGSGLLLLAVGARLRRKEERT